MDLEKKIRDLEVVYELFKIELAFSSDIMLELAKEARKILVYQSLAICTMPYDSVSEPAYVKLHEILVLARKFNLTCELHLRSLRSKSSNLEQAPAPRFFHGTNDLSKFPRNTPITCIITSIANREILTFYVNVVDNLVHTPLDLARGLPEYMQTYNNVPDEDEVFGIYVEDVFTRAVREKGLFRRRDFRIFLIDYGKIIRLSDNTKIYKIPALYQKIPAEAILCKLVGINPPCSINLNEFLIARENTKQNIYIVGYSESMLFVKIDISEIHRGNEQKRAPMASSSNECSEIENINIKELKVTLPEEDTCKEISKVSKFKEFKVPITSSCKINIPMGTKNVKEPVQTRVGPDACKGIQFDKFFRNTEDFYFQNMTSSNCNDINYYNGDLRETEGNISTDSLDDFDDIWGNDVCTTNALQAVMGYIPKDDRRICRFYNPKTKSCFKGALCKFEHVPKIKEGWTRDQSELVINVPNEICLASLGSLTKLFITHVVNIEHIFAQFDHYKAKKQILQLHSTMNSPDFEKKYRRLDYIPATFELVLSRYKDNMWYRAKVLHKVNSEEVKVFYVDYGNCETVSIDRLRRWDQRFSTIPFQAVLCRLVGVKEKPDVAEIATKFLRDEIINQTLLTQVLGCFDQLYIKLKDTSGVDVAEQLIESNLADPFETIIPSERNERIPA